MSELAPIQIWWTANELADAKLPDMPGTQQSIERWVKRINLRANPSLARRRAGRGGGWEYHWTALPLAARKALLAVASAPVQAPDRGEMWEWFEGLPLAVQRRTRVRLRCIQSVEALEVHLSRDLAVREVAVTEGVSPRTLWNWLALIEGVRGDDRLPHLAPRHRAAKRKDAKIEINEDLFDWLKADYLRLAGPSFSSCYRRAVIVARTKGWSVSPERTLRRRLDERVSQPADRCHVIFTNTGHERAETLDFVWKVGDHLQVPITWLEYRYDNAPRAIQVGRNDANLTGKPFEDLLRRKRRLPNQAERFCTARSVCSRHAS